MKNRVNKVFKWIFWTSVSLVVLVLLLTVSIQIPFVQNKLKDVAINFLEEKIQTKVALNRFYVNFPNEIELDGLYLQDQAKDTLIFSEQLRVSVNLFDLLKNKANITNIEVLGLVGNVKRDNDGRFNFDYIVDAFASKTVDTTAVKSNFEIDLDQIRLKKIAFNFEDKFGGNDVKLKLLDFETQVDKFDLKNLLFSVPTIRAQGLKVAVKRDLLKEIIEETVAKVDEVADEKPLQIQLKKIDLSDFDVTYWDDNTKVDAKIVFDKLKTQIEHIDLPNLDFKVNSLTFNQAQIAVKLLENPVVKKNTPIDIKADAIKQVAPKFALNKVNLNNLKVSFYNLNHKKQVRGLDFNYLDFNKIDFDASDLMYTSNQISGVVNATTIEEKSGLSIDDFETDFYYGPKKIQVSNLYLKTPQTLLKDEVLISYANISDLSNNLGNVAVTASLKKSKIGFKDLILLVPDLTKQDVFKNNPNGILNIDTRISGKINDLSLPNFRLSGLRGSDIELSGKIKNALQPNQLYVDLDVSKLKSTQTDILSILPRGTLPQNITLPDHFLLQGKLKGGIKQANADLKLASSFGNATFLGKLDQRKKNAEIYDLQANLQDFNIGKLIQNDSLSQVTATVAVAGNSFDSKVMSTTISGNIATAKFNGYLYENLNLQANVNQGNYVADVKFKDANADLLFEASGNFLNEHPTLELDGTIEKLDLYKMKLTANPSALKGTISADFSDLHPDHLNGKLRLYNFAYADGKQVIPFDSLKIDAISTSNINKLYVQSQILDAKIEGKYTLTQLPELLMQSISKYYEIVPNQDNASPNETYFDLDARVKNDRILYLFLPDLKNFETASIKANYKSETDYLNLQATFPNLIYGANTIKNVSLQADTDRNKLVYNLGIEKLQSDKYQINQINLSGDVIDDKIQYLFQILDSDKKQQYQISGELAALETGTRISLDPNGLMLNYDTWTVTADNSIDILTQSQGIKAKNFILENNGSQLAINSINEAANAPIDVAFKNFEIESLTHIIKKDSLLARGKINGKAQLREITTDLKFVGDLLISDLEIMNSKVGNLDVKVTNARREDTYNALITLTENGNDVRVFGGYNPKIDALRLQANIKSLQLLTLQGFANQTISNPSGYLSGDLKISGGLAAPKINGEVKFNEVGLTVNALNATFKNINHPILFTDEGIRFNQFQITDSENNKLSLNGRILTSNYSDFKFNLRLRANDFKLMNSTAKDNDLFYGKLYIDTNLNISGDMNLPVVDGSIKVNENTDFTFVLPSTDPSIADREGIVEFIDEDNLVLQQTLEMKEELNQSKIKGLNVNASISINKQATLNIIIDKQNGDKLTVFGEAELTGGIDPSGKTSLTGTYEIDKGSYQMSFNFIKRKFEIEKGSTLVWTGEPTSANANITAIYKTNTSPIDLLDSQLQGMSTSERNKYKQRVPFETHLMMNGELLKPEISFDIQIPEENYNISSDIESAIEEKLRQIRNDQAEMNKQVIALLVLNRFIGENPFASSAGTSVSGMARQSVSKIISQQLNNLASEIVNGFELNFDLESADDFSTGEAQTRTDLNVELSKRLFDDRLKITIGSNFGLEGEERANEQMTNIAGDISAEYSITEDGRYLVRAYRKNRYQVAFQGQVIETGVGFIITMSYDKFKEIFQKRKENREFRRQRNQQNRKNTPSKSDTIPNQQIDTLKQSLQLRDNNFLGEAFPLKKSKPFKVSFFYDILKPEDYI